MPPHRLSAGVYVQEVEEENEQGTLMEKFRAHYHGTGLKRDTLICTDRISSGLYMFTLFTGYYVGMIDVIPDIYGREYPDYVYPIQVMLTFVFIQVVANWLCVRCYETGYFVTRDRPNLRKTLWEDVPIIETMKIENGLGNRHQENTNNSVGAKMEQESFSSKEEMNLSWKRCLFCQHEAPPRSHHCRDCRKCVLKHDHHCYFVGRCIGYYNQRYFIVLAFYTGLGSWVSFLHILYYLHSVLPDDMDWYDYAFPYTIYTWLAGKISFHVLLLISHCYILWWSGLLGCGFFVWEMIIVCSGKTTFEVRQNLNVVNLESMRERLRSVFGDFWFLNFILPLQLLFRQAGDGTEWKNVKKYNPRGQPMKVVFSNKDH